MVRIRYAALSLLGLSSFTSAAPAEAPAGEPPAGRAMELQQRELELQLNLGLAGVRALEREATPATEAGGDGVIDEAEGKR